MERRQQRLISNFELRPCKSSLNILSDKRNKHILLMNGILDKKGREIDDSGDCGTV